MLVLTRRIDEAIVIDGGITVTVLSIQGNKVRLGITAPETVRVDRQEIREQKAKQAASPTVVAGAPDHHQETRRQTNLSV